MADHLPNPQSRSLEILDSIRMTFAEKGFDGASMQDLARAAGMSVGNFYRYFPSKAAMVEAIVTRDLEEVETQLSAVTASGDPMAMLRAGLHERILQESGGCHDGPLWAEIGAAALRKPEIGAIVEKMEAEVSRYLTDAFALASGLSSEEAARRYSAHAAMAVMLVKASAMQARTAGKCGCDLTDLVLRMIDMILDDISMTEAKD